MARQLQRGQLRRHRKKLTNPETKHKKRITNPGTIPREGADGTRNQSWSPENPTMRPLHHVASTPTTASNSNSSRSVAASPTQQRRSSRRIPKKTTASSKLPILAFEPPWVRHYIDIGFCRLTRCTARIRTVPDSDIAHLTTSFLAMAITAAVSSGYKSHEDQERLLLEYAQAVIRRGVAPNDCHGGKSAVGAAAYYGFTRLLEVLLEAGCSVTTSTGRDSQTAPQQEHALKLAVCNSKHASMRILFQYRSEELKAILQREPFFSHQWMSTAGFAISRVDTKALEILRTRGNALLSDRDVCKPEKRAKLGSMLQEMYGPTTISNAMCWSKALHWSFPLSDRRVLNWMWYAIVNNNKNNYNNHGNDEQEGRKLVHLPSELWMRIFGFMGRNWFAANQKSHFHKQVVDWMGITASNIIAD